MDYLQGPGSAPLQPGLATALDCEHTITTGGDEDWSRTTGADSSYYDNDAAVSDSGLNDNESTWMETTVTASAGDNAIPHEQDSLAKAIGRTHFRYTQYINRF